MPGKDERRHLDESQRAARLANLKLSKHFLASQRMNYSPESSFRPGADLGPNSDSARY
jgi:hypothetical protein